MRICKNNDGLKPVIKKCKDSLYVGYGHCVDILIPSLSQCSHQHLFDSVIYDLIVNADRVIAVLELGIVIFDASGTIMRTHDMHDIVNNYRICNNKLLVSTLDGQTFEIGI